MLGACESSLLPRRSPASGPGTSCTCNARLPRRRCCSTRSSRGRPSSRTVSVVHLHCEGPGPHLAPEMAPHFRHRALFIGPNARAAVNEGRADFVPVFLSDVPRLFDSGMLPLDCVFVNATPPDAHGFCSLGTSVEAMHAAIRAAKTVIVQFNQRGPEDPRRQLHPRRRDRPRDRVRRAALRGPPAGDRRRRAPDRRVRGRPDPRRRDDPDRDRCDPGRRRAASCSTSTTSASTPRCSPTPSSTSSRRA